jgi:hypothetical protein
VSSILGSTYIVPDMRLLTPQDEAWLVLEGCMLDGAFAKWHVSSFKYQQAVPATC